MQDYSSVIAIQAGGFNASTQVEDQSQVAEPNATNSFVQSNVVN